LTSLRKNTKSINFRKENLNLKKARISAIKLKFFFCINTGVTQGDSPLVFFRLFDVVSEWQYNRHSEALRNLLYLSSRVYTINLKLFDVVSEWQHNRHSEVLRNLWICHSERMWRIFFFKTFRPCSMWQKIKKLK
jgi:hypothetical protein